MSYYDIEAPMTEPYYDDELCECEACNKVYSAELLGAIGSDTCHHCLYYEGEMNEQDFVYYCQLEGQEIELNKMEAVA